MTKIKTQLAKNRMKPSQYNQSLTWKPKAYTIPDVKTERFKKQQLKDFHLIPGTRQGCHLLSILLEILPQSNEGGGTFKLEMKK